MKLEAFKELMGVETIEFNQYTEGKRMIADVKGVRVVMSSKFDKAKPAYIKKGLSDEQGNVINPDVWVLFNQKDAIATVTL